MTIEVDETLPNGLRISGTHSAGFEALHTAFRENFLSRREIGASVCVHHLGKVVADLWGGTADLKTERPWESDTISIVFSCTKGVTALCALRLVADGKLALHAPVTNLWPEFGANGKEATTLAMMLDHTSPVPHLRDPLPSGALADWDMMVARIAAEPAWWEPGTRQGYHGLTFAWTVGNMVRLAAGEPLADYFRKTIAIPQNLDFHIGLPESEEPRVAPMIKVDPADANFQSPFLQAVMTDPSSLPHLFMSNTGGADFNSCPIHAAEIGSANGITNARGLAGLYAPLAAGGASLLPTNTVAALGRATAATHRDATLLQPMRFSRGFMVSTDNREHGGDSLLIGESAFGHVGMGGSVGFADPANDLSFGYTMNRMGAGILLNERGQSLVDAAYRSIGLAGNASGAWR